MSVGFRVVVETYDLQSDEALTREQVDSFPLQAPDHIREVGLDQQHQLTILQTILDKLLPKQFVLLDDNDICPECGKQTKKAGRYSSKFHSVYTDHRVQMVRRMCRCGWRRKYTVEGLFGFSSHPDLLKMQCDLGSEQSYMKAQETLSRKHGYTREVNNRTNISRNVALFGAALSELKTQTSDIKAMQPAKTIIAQIDGGHIPANSEGKRSYEVLIGKFYRPENVVAIDDNRNKIMSSTCIGSAKSDSQRTIKKQVVHAALKEGMTMDTTVYLVADGAKNCWSAASLLKGKCKELVSILDWSHIGRTFKHAEQELPVDYHEQLERAKWQLWHGDCDKCISTLDEINKFLCLTMKLPRLTKLKKYITNNKGNIIDYATYKKEALPFTSSVIESAVDVLINDRQKRTRKMQWTREGAHPIVQLRASKISGTWNTDWNNALEYLLAA